MKKKLRTVTLKMDEDLYQLFRHKAYWDAMPVSHAIVKRLKPMTEKEFNSGSVDLLTERVTLIQIKKFLRQEGILEQEKPNEDHN
jgi:predicted deacylase